MHSMALKNREREEIVGKRFLCVHSVANESNHSNSSANHRSKRFKLCQYITQNDTHCQRGTVRAATHHDPHHQELNILVEFDGQDWKKRQWIRVYGQNPFRLFLIEHTLVWFRDHNISIPSLNFKTLVDKIGFEENKLKPIEILSDKRVEFVDYKDLTVYQDSDLENRKADIEAPEVRKALRKWTQFQDSQRILLTTPSVLFGNRVKVYRSEGTTQWYTAVIVTYNDNTRELTLTDDTVLEEHNEDPSLVQMKLIGDGVVESILKGEDIGITPRRRTCNQNQTNSYTRNRSGTTSSTITGNNCALNVITNSTISISQQSATTPTNPSTQVNTNSICGSVNTSNSVTRNSRKSRRNSSETILINKDSKDSPIPSPAATSDTKGRGVTTITTDNKNTINIRNNCETSLKKHCKDKETTDNSVDQPLNQTNRSKRSVNHHKCKSDVKKLDNNSNNGTKNRNLRQRDSETNAQKSKDSVDNSCSSDTEIEDTSKTSTDNHKRKVRSKRNHKKCINSSDSDVNGSEEDSEPQVITSGTVVISNSDNNLNDVKDSNVLENDKLKENNESNELKSRTDLVDHSNSAFDDNPNVITSVKCVPQTSSQTTISTTKSNSVSVIQNDHNLNLNNSVNERFGNVSQMVPTMCSLDEQLNTSAPNTSKPQSFPTRSNVISSKTDNKSNSHPHLNSGVVCSINSSDNSSHNTTNCENNNKSADELNDSKRSIQSLALDRHESVTVYRDPNLVDKQTIRHIESVQHLSHGLMHSVNTTSASDFARMPTTGSQARAIGQPSIVSPSVSSVPSQYKLKSQPIHSHSSSQSPHLMNSSSHTSHRHSAPMDPQLYHHLMQNQHQMVSGLYSPAIDMFGSQKNYSQLSSMPANSPWNLYNEQIRAQLLHGSDPKQSALRIDREIREEKEKQIKLEKESKEYMERERNRLEMFGKEKEDNAKEAVDQHFEESLRLARQKKSGWSPISNLPLTKTQPNISRQSHVLPQHQSKHSVPHLSQQPSVKTNISYGSRDYERERLSKDNDTERWLAYMHHQQQQQQQQQQQHHQQSHSQTHPTHSSRVSVAEAMAKHKQMESGRHLQSQSHHLQSSLMNETSSKGSTSSPVMEASKHHQMTSRAKHEPTFSLYGYPSNQNISYITAAQLKENNRLSISSGVSVSPLMTGRTDMSKVPPPAAHCLDKRESPKIDRSLTPNSRNSTPIGRPPSLSPKQKSPKMMAPDRVSPLYHRSQSQSIKQYEYSLANAPPAHQSTSSRSATPLLSSSPIALQLQNQIPAAHSSQNQEQPQNLVKSDSKCKINFNEMTKSQLEMQRQSPNASVLHMKGLPNLSTGYQSFSLIQQGLVPNPIYKALPTTQSIPNATSMTSVITRPHSTKPSSCTTQSQPQPSQSSHMFPKPGPGIMSGIPICRPNSIPYYEPNRTNSTNSHKYSSNMSVSCIKSDSSNTYPEMNRSVKVSTHPPYNATQDRNVFHRMASSPHSPRIPVGSVPQSPYGPPPGMISVNSNITHQSHTSPPAAHSGVNPYNVKRKSLEPISNPLNKKQKVIESLNNTQTLNIKVENTINNNTTQSTCNEMSDLLSQVPAKTSNLNQDIKKETLDLNTSQDLLESEQKLITVVANDTLTTSSPLNPKSPINDIKCESKLTTSTSNAMTSGSSISTTSSFHPKLKKAWLQRHSEDKTGSSVATTSISGVTIKNNSDNSNSSADNSKDTKASDVTVNGVINKNDDSKEGEDESEDDDTTSASETEELSNSSKGSKRKAHIRSAKTRKRLHNQSRDKDMKKRKSNPDLDINKDKVGKENEDKKKREKKDKDSDKDSNDTRSSTTTRRGRKPKVLKNDEKEKSPKETSSSSLKKKNLQKGKSDRTAIAELKKSGKHFLQGGSCVEVAPKLPKCRECRMTPTQRNRKPTIFCRFYDYRKLAFKSNVLTIAGFSQPQDANEDDLKLWLPSEDLLNDLDTETAKFVIAHVGDQFCDLVKQEKEAQLLHMGSTNKNITWKRVVQGVREMCDVCETTLFNIHWVCDKCGFVVCIDCYKARKVGSIKEELCPAKDRDGFQWLLCNNRQQHEPQKLEVTQIIAASALSSLGRMLHSLRTKWSIRSNCTCVTVALKDMANKKPNGFTKQVLSVVKIDNKQVNGVNETNNKNWKSINGSVAIIKQETDSTLTGYSSESGNSPLSFFVDVALTSEKLISKSPTIKEENEIKPKKKSSIKLEKDMDMSSDGDDDNKHSTLRELLMGPTSKPPKDSKSNGSPLSDSQMTPQKTSNDCSEHDSKESDLDKDENCETVELTKELQHFTRRYFPLRKESEPLPIICRTLDETKKQYPLIPHNWFCGGRLLVLHEPKNSNNIHIFQEQWIRGQPVLVKDNHKNLNAQLWHPDSFSRDFGDIKNDLINCLNGDILSKQPMRKFWDGFENLQIRMKDKSGEYMLLKLKDWPPDEEFSELLPTRYKDLMSSLPLPEYTNRNGVLNLAGRLPECFVRPDLGPKMYSAYGSCVHSDKGTTNLHLDISDAVNVMIFVGIPKEIKTEKDCLQEVQTAVDNAGCDELMRKRVREKGTKVGALWHIYNARDADKIRDLLNKVAIERGETLEPHHDPIHDQSWYLDETLRSRLLKEYGVEGYAIAQCLGDAIFIPAGAPHQVRNLNSCVKVAGDFVSPENVSHCFNLTQEFRQLSDTHTNHEDKLQIKNIIYHAVKDALSVLRNHHSPPNDTN